MASIAAGLVGAARLLYAAAFPAIAVTLLRARTPGPASGRGARHRRALAAGCVLYAAGEACGYLRLPAASAEARMERYEMRKRLFVGAPRR